MISLISFTPPEAIVGTFEVSAISCVNSTFTPHNIPSFAMSVHIIASTPAFANSCAKSVAFIVDTSAHPSTATIPFIASIPTAIGYLAAISFTKAGLVSAIDPKINLSTPKSKYIFIVASSLIPPPSSIFKLQFSLIFLICSKLAGSPLKAPFKSTICNHLEPSSSKRLATCHGSSEYIFALSIRPFVSLTAFPSFKSIAGKISILFILS